MIKESSWEDTILSELNNIKAERVSKFRDTHNIISFSNYQQLLEFIAKNNINKNLKITTDCTNPTLIYDK